MSILHEKSFAVSKYAKYWSLLNEAQPKDIALSTHTKYLFKCDLCKHYFTKSPNNLLNITYLCSFCTNQQLCDEYHCLFCYNKSFASHEKAKYWLYDKNNVTSREVFCGSKTLYWFKCNICQHEFQQMPKRITSKQECWCNYCSSNILCDNKECIICFNKSFASHHRSNELIDEDKDKARMIFRGTKDKLKFECKFCFHIYETNISNITNHNTGCSYCASELLCNDEDCLYCWCRSFESHLKSKYMIIKNGITPRKIFKSTKSLMPFKCNICNHEFKTSPSSIYHLNAFCPYCGHKKLCDKNDCIDCYNKSFASHEKSKFYIESQSLKPREFFKYASHIGIFYCNKCKTNFQIKIAQVSQGIWCQNCRTTTENKLYDKLIEFYPNLKRQKKFDDLKSDKNRHYLFDFCIEENKIIIELDGLQHFEQVFNWKSPESQQQSDFIKMKYANNNGYSIIRILQEDVYKNAYDWLNELIGVINKIITDQKIQNIFMCRNDEYILYKENFCLYMKL
ncbi:MAG: restriction endonuclease [Terrestrivirus sp.]|uniref:Restriction endonuclease n=1 Tax=Terrestrivirus sp. TaxID=2487775 RepID=A0A3G4ZP81_9VIRU|nr:MAG: restriction endonuclease [Terrestrivirus sp.]